MRDTKKQPAPVPERSGRAGPSRLPEDLRALSNRIRRSQKAYERMNGKKRG